MNPLERLRLVAKEGGYDFILDDEILGSCKFASGHRLAEFTVNPDQRRRGVGRRAMELLLATVPPSERFEIEVPNGDPVGRAFAEAVGFGVKGLVYDRRGAPSEETVELFRPVGQTEMDLIEASGMRAFPPRLPDQPIFYPVTTIEYARLIARDWNVRDDFSGNVGYVLRFRVKRDFLDRHPVREAGGRDLLEHWIPAEELPNFNRNPVGLIELVERHDAS